MDEIRESDADLGKRFVQKQPSSDIAAGYYSNWYYTAVHMLLTLDQYQAPASIAQRLGLSLAMTTNILSQLEHWKIIESVHGGWKVVETSLHVSKSSPYHLFHHNNWRTRAVVSPSATQSDALNYTAICSLSLEDYGRIRDIFVEAIEASRKITLKSDPEDAFACTLDFFRI